MEYFIRYHSFEHCQNAMRYLSDKKLKAKQEGNDSFYEWMSLANDFLALSRMTERQPVKNFEHYPRLAKEWALECLRYAFKPTKEQESFFLEYNQNYIDSFELMEYLEKFQ